MGQIQISATFPNISGANLDEFTKRAEEAVAMTRDEPGNLQYDWFLSADKTKCVVRETYASSDAVLAHLGRVGEMLGPLVELGGGLDIEAFGDPSPELAEAVADMAPTVYSYLTGK